MSGKKVSGTFGEPSPSISKHLQPLEFIKFPSLEKADFSAEMASDYENGFSVLDVALKYGCSKHLVLKTLKRRSVKTRPNRALDTSKASRYKGRGRSKPYYGFCYFEGALKQHPIEFQILQIHPSEMEDGPHSSSDCARIESERPKSVKEKIGVGRP